MQKCFVDKETLSDFPLALWWEDNDQIFILGQLFFKDWEEDILYK